MWFGVPKSMVSLHRFLLWGSYLTSSDVFNLFMNGISSKHLKNVIFILSMGFDEIRTTSLIRYEYARNGSAKRERCALNF